MKQLNGKKRNKTIAYIEGQIMKEHIGADPKDVKQVVREKIK